jgi:putative transposase
MIIERNWRRVACNDLAHREKKGEDDDHSYTVVRYVERNALRAGLIDEAEARRWSSLWRHSRGGREARRLLTPWPLPRPWRWLEHVHQPQTDAEFEGPRRAVQRNSPFGSADWQQRTAKRLGLEAASRPRGRPRKGA